MKLILDRRVSRMTLQVCDRELLGLPALAAAIGQRHAVLGILILFTLPAMLALEKIRSAATS